MPHKNFFLLSGITLFWIIFLTSCMEKEDTDSQTDTVTPCQSNRTVDTSRGDCNQTLSITPEFSSQLQGTNRIIKTNNIPNHKVGLFGRVPGSLNPNSISAQSKTYNLTQNPVAAATLTPLLSNRGPAFSFGVLLNGVELDPVAAEPFPHQGMMNPNVNWDWNLEALNVNLGLDCNNAHVQPSGKYHYHGAPVMYLESLTIPANKMTLIGYAADGFPIYFKNAYSNPTDTNSAIVEMKSSYRLKSGNRPGDGVTAPCGTFNGVYSADYEYVKDLGTLDEANGRTGVTPEYPNGTYYYILTEGFPIIPRFLRGTPSNDFRIQ